MTYYYQDSVGERFLYPIRAPGYHYGSFLRTQAAVVFTWLAICTCLHAGDYTSRRIDEVVAGFRILTPTIRSSQRLCVKLLLHNLSKRPKTFAYGASLVPDVLVFDGHGRELPLRSDAPTIEPVAPRISLKPGESFDTDICSKIGEYYELLPGRYYLQFRYDLRLIGDTTVARRYMELYRSDDFIVWDRRRYFFSVVK